MVRILRLLIPQETVPFLTANGVCPAVPVADTVRSCMIKIFHSTIFQFKTLWTIVLYYQLQGTSFRRLHSYMDYCIHLFRNLIRNKGCTLLHNILNHKKTTNTKHIEKKYE